MNQNNKNLQKSSSVKPSSSGTASSKVPTATSSGNNRVPPNKPGISTRSGPSAWSGSPSRRIYKERRAATRLLERYGNVSVTSESLKARLAWAKRVLDTSKEVKKEPVPKRQRSLDESASKPDAKKAKFRGNATTTKSFSDTLKGSIIMAVIDENDPDGTINPEKWDQIERKLLDLFIEVLKEFPGTIPKCRDGGWFQGHVKLVACVDQRSVDLFRIAISRMGEVWPGAKLKVVAKEQIPGRPRARSWIPAEPSDPQRILELIRVGNPDLNTSTWKVTKLEEAKGKFRSVSFVIDKASLAILARSGGVLNYGFFPITMRVYKKDEEQSSSDVRESAAISQHTADPLSKVGNIKPASMTEVGPVIPSEDSPVCMDISMSAPSPAHSITSEESIGMRYLFDEEELLMSNDSEEDSAFDVTVVEKNGSTHTEDAGTAN
ncbi:uncharacterized protein LOC119665375 [Teleopsis dalmanni]|uniref:uncharacterized protein LOC119665375 n=2 Tax=Teleopsis dalmanni TaxID=139649 RepID=UPI0018CEB81B|nr:uncharacterized protein LOC119665375 [Teleopsis dalmanni]